MQNDRRIEEVLVHPMKMMITIIMTRIIQIQTKKTTSIQFKVAIVIGSWRQYGLNFFEIDPP